MGKKVVPDQWTNKAVEQDCDSDGSSRWCASNTEKKKGEKNENKRKNQDHPHHSIVLIGNNTENSPWDLWRLIDSQTPVKYF